MAIGSVLLVGLLAMAPNWAIVDIPYPESAGAVEAHPPPTPQAQVAEALAIHARGKALAVRKSDIVDIKVDGPHATARLALPNYNEVFQLEYVNREWKVVRPE